MRVQDVRLVQVQDNHAAIHSPKENEELREPKGRCLGLTQKGNKIGIRGGWMEGTM